MAQQLTPTWLWVASQVGSKAPADGRRSFSSGLHNNDGTERHGPPDNVPVEFLQQQMAMEDVGTRPAGTKNAKTFGNVEPCWFCSISEGRVKMGSNTLSISPEGFLI
jgi:hypothetical protein